MDYSAKDPVLGSLLGYFDWCKENERKKIYKTAYLKFKRFEQPSKPYSAAPLINSSNKNGVVSGAKWSKKDKESDKRKGCDRIVSNGSESNVQTHSRSESIGSDSYIDLLELANYSCHYSTKKSESNKNTAKNTKKINTNKGTNKSNTNKKTDESGTQNNIKNNLKNAPNTGGKNVGRKRMDLGEVPLERLSTVDSLGSLGEFGSGNLIEDSEEFRYESLLCDLRRRGFEPKTLGDVLRSRKKQWAKTQCIHSSARDDFVRHLNMYKNHFRSYKKTLDGWIPKECNVDNKSHSRSALNGKMTSRRNIENLTWSNIIFCPNFRPGGEIIYRFSRKTMKTYNTLYDTIKKGWVHPDLLVCLVRDASHPVRFATPPDQDCYTAIYTGPEISENLDTKVIFGEYTGIVYREDCVPDSIFEYAFELNFTSASWVDAELEFRHDKQYIRDVNGTIFLPNSSKYVLDSTHAFNELSMVNHCQSIAAYGGEYFLQANCEWQQVIFDGWPHVILTNKQGVKIQTGDELIADFGALWFQKVEENCHRQLKRELISYRLLSTANKSDDTVDAGKYLDDAVDHKSLHADKSLKDKLINDNFHNDKLLDVDNSLINKIKENILVQELPSDRSLENLDYFVVNNNTSYVCAICLDEDLNDDPNTSTKKIFTHRKNSTSSTQYGVSDSAVNVGQPPEEFRDEDDEDECIVCDGCDRIFHIKCLEKITTTALNYVQTEFQKTKFINFQTYLQSNKYNLTEGNLINLNLIKWYCMYCRYLCKQIIQHDLNQDFMPLQSCIYMNSTDPSPELPDSSQESVDSHHEIPEKIPVTNHDKCYSSTNKSLKSEVLDEKKEQEPETDECEVELVNNNLIDLNKITNYFNKLICNTGDTRNNSDTTSKENSPTPKDDYTANNNNNVDNVKGKGLNNVEKKGNKSMEREYPKQKRKKIKSSLSLKCAKRKNKKSMVKTLKTKSKLFKGNKIRTLRRMKLINKPTTLEIAKYLVKQKILSNTTNRGQIRLFGNYINFRTNCCPSGSPRPDTIDLANYKDRNNTIQTNFPANTLSPVSSHTSNHSYKDSPTTNANPTGYENDLTINLFNLGLISLNAHAPSNLLESESKVASSEETCSTNSGNELDLAMEDANNCNVAYSELLRKCNDTINSRNSSGEKVNGYDTSTKTVNSPIIKDNQESYDTTNPPNSPAGNENSAYHPTMKVKENQEEVFNVNYDNSIMNNIIDYLNCRYLMGMWQVEPFSVFGEAVRVCVDCNKKCGPKANVYVCRVLKRHLSGNFDHPKATNVEQMKELILISFEQHINYLLRLLVLKNIVIDFFIKLSCHFLTNNYALTDSPASTVKEDPDTAGYTTTFGNTGDDEPLSDTMSSEDNSEESSEKDDISEFDGKELDIEYENLDVEELQFGEEIGSQIGNEIKPQMSKEIETQVSREDSELVEKTQMKLRDRGKKDVKEESGVSGRKRQLYYNINEFVKCITNNMKRVPQGDIMFNYELLKKLGGFEEDFVRIVNCDDLFKYINDLSSYMCYNADQVPSTIQQILSKDELMRFTHFRKYLIKDVNLFVNTSSNISNKGSEKKNKKGQSQDISEYYTQQSKKSDFDHIIKSTNSELEYWDTYSRRFSDEIDEDTVKINLNNIIKHNKRILKLRPDDVQSQEFIPMIGIKPGRTIIYRKFSNGYYQGLVNKYTNSTTYFKVEYSDGDDELMDPFDLMNEIILNLSNIENILLQLSTHDVNNERFVQQIELITNLIKNKMSSERSNIVYGKEPNVGNEVNGVRTSEEFIEVKEDDIRNHSLFKKMASELRNYMLHQLINVEYISKRRKCSQ